MIQEKQENKVMVRRFFYFGPGDLVVSALVPVERLLQQPRVKGTTVEVDDQFVSEVGILSFVNVELLFASAAEAWEARAASLSEGRLNLIACLRQNAAELVSATSEAIKARQAEG